MNSEKKEFEYREDSLLLALFRIVFRLSKIKCKAWNEIFEANLFSWEVSELEFEGKIKPAAVWKFGFEDRDKWILLEFLEFPDYRISDPGNRKNGSSMGCSCTCFKLSIEVSMKRIKTLKLEKKCVPFSWWITIKCTFFQCSNYQKPDATINSWKFPVKSSSTSVQFSVEIFIEKVEPVFTVKREFECRNVSVLRAFLGIFWLSGLWCKCQS